MGGMNTSSQQLAVSRQQMTVGYQGAVDSAYGIISGMKHSLFDIGILKQVQDDGVQL